MTPDAVLCDLLRRWEEARQRGESVTPEQLCRDCPDRVSDLRRRIAALDLRAVGTAEPTASGAGPAPAPLAPAAQTLLQSCPPVAPGPEPAPGPPAGRYRPLRPHAKG